MVERREVEPIPRAGTVLPRPLELFDARGIAEQFIRRTSEVNPNPYQSFHIWAGMAPVSWSARDSRFGFTLMLAQHETEDVLRRWALDCGVELRFRHEMVEVHDSGEVVTAVVRDRERVTSSVQARFVVGADGGRSRTREQVGIDVVGHGDTFTGVIATAKMQFPWPGTTRTERNEHGWVAANPFGLGLTRFTMVHAEGRALARTEPVSIPELNQSLTEILGEPIDIPELVAASRYGDAMWMASKFREGRVFLVGEAARIHYPASGVGMNFCIQDAFNLGWKLGAVIRGDAGEALLDTYEAERRPIADDLFRSVNAQVAIQFDFSPRGLAFTQHFSKHLLTKPEVTEHCGPSSTASRVSTRNPTSVLHRSGSPRPISRCSCPTDPRIVSTNCSGTIRSSCSTSAEPRRYAVSSHRTIGSQWSKRTRYDGPTALARCVSADRSPRHLCGLGDHFDAEPGRSFGRARAHHSR